MAAVGLPDPAKEALRRTATHEPLHSVHRNGFLLDVQKMSSLSTCHDVYMYTCCKLTWIYHFFDLGVCTCISSRRC